MSHREFGICVVTHKQATTWKATGERPNCKHHHHVSYKVAMQLIEQEAAYALPQRGIVIYDCVLKYEWTGAPSGCFQVMQMKPIVQ